MFNKLYPSLNNKKLNSKKFKEKNNKDKNKEKSKNKNKNKDKETTNKLLNGVNKLQQWHQKK